VEIEITEEVIKETIMTEEDIEEEETSTGIGDQEKTGQEDVSTVERKAILPNNALNV
jgi:hypothetical protein